MRRVESGPAGSPTTSRLTAFVSHVSSSTTFESKCATVMRANSIPRGGDQPPPTDADLPLGVHRTGRVLVPEVRSKCMCAPDRAIFVRETLSNMHGGPMPVGVRRAGRADVDAASAVLADAFADYPWTQWTVESYRHSERVEGLQRLSMDRIALPYGEIWVACDDDDDVISVAVWMLPNSAVPASVLNEIGAPQATLEGARHEASVMAEACVARLRPTMPHYYLGAVGTRRDRQREGLGAAVLSPILDRADRGANRCSWRPPHPRMSASMSGSGWSRLVRLTYPTVVPTSGR